MAGAPFGVYRRGRARWPFPAVPARHVCRRAP